MYNYTIYNSVQLLKTSFPTRIILTLLSSYQDLFIFSNNKVPLTRNWWFLLKFTVILKNRVACFLIIVLFSNIFYITKMIFTSIKLTISYALLAWTFGNWPLLFCQKSSNDILETTYFELIQIHGNQFLVSSHGLLK